MLRYIEALEDAATDCVHQAHAANLAAPGNVASLAYAIGTNGIKTGRFPFERQELMDAIKDVLETPSEEQQRQDYLRHLISKDD